MGRRLQRIRRKGPPPQPARTMRDKNLLLFILLSSLIIVGWFYLRQMTQTPETEKKEQDAQLAKNKEATKDPLAKEKEEPKKKSEEPAPKQEKPEAPEEVVAPTEETIGGEGDYFIE